MNIFIVFMLGIIVTQLFIMLYMRFLKDASDYKNYNKEIIGKLSEKLIKIINENNKNNDVEFRKLRREIGKNTTEIEGGWGFSGNLYNDIRENSLKIESLFQGDVIREFYRRRNDIILSKVCDDLDVDFSKLAFESDIFELIIKSINDDYNEEIIDVEYLVDKKDEIVKKIKFKTNLTDVPPDLNVIASEILNGLKESKNKEETLKDKDSNIEPNNKDINED